MALVLIATANFVNFFTMNAFITNAENGINTIGAMVESV